MIHLGFTGTRHGLSQHQGRKVADLVDSLGADVIAHHGCCVGADEDFHAICRERRLRVIGHPGPGWPDGELCARVVCDETLDPQPYMVRNTAIVVASQAMIAAPLEAQPRLRGGTWATIRMARAALKAYQLQTLYVVGRDGQLLDHGAWP